VVDVEHGLGGKGALEGAVEHGGHADAEEAEDMGVEGLMDDLRTGHTANLGASDGEGGAAVEFCRRTDDEGAEDHRDPKALDIRSGASDQVRARPGEAWRIAWCIRGLSLEISCRRR